MTAGVRMALQRGPRAQRDPGRDEHRRRRHRRVGRRRRVDLRRQPHAPARPPAPVRRDLARRGAQRRRARRGQSRHRRRAGRIRASTGSRCSPAHRRRYAAARRTLVVLLPRRGRIDPPVLEGRLPRGDDEIAVGTRTLNDLHLHVGDTAPIRVWSDDAPVHHVRIVGRAVLTPGARSFGNAADMGEGHLPHRGRAAPLHPERLRPTEPVHRRRPFPARRDSGRRTRLALERRLGGERKGWFVETPGTPETLVDFGNVRNLPLLLGGVLALIAAIGIAHLLVTSIRRRRHDLAILKTLGFVPAQVRRAIAWQATTLAVVALAASASRSAIICGRLIWSVFADQVGVLAETVTPASPRRVAVVTVVLAVVIVARPGPRRRPHPPGPDPDACRSRRPHSPAVTRLPSDRRPDGRVAGDRRAVHGTRRWPVKSAMRHVLDAAVVPERDVADLPPPPARELGARAVRERGSRAAASPRAGANAVESDRVLRVHEQAPCGRSPGARARPGWRCTRFARRRSCARSCRRTCRGRPASSASTR